MSMKDTIKADLGVLRGADERLMGARHRDAEAAVEVTEPAAHRVTAQLH